MERKGKRIPPKVKVSRTNTADRYLLVQEQLDQRL